MGVFDVLASSIQVTKETLDDRTVEKPLGSGILQIGFRNVLPCIIEQVE